MVGFMQSYLPTKNDWQNSFQQWGLTTLIFIALHIMSACSNTQQLPPAPQLTATPPLPALISELTADTLPTLIVTEREASISSNLPLLEILWAEDGRIVDGRG